MEDRISTPQSGPEIDRQALAHTMPAESPDPDLDLILSVWDRLAQGFKDKLVETIREQLTDRE